MAGQIRLVSPNTFSKPLTLSITVCCCCQRNTNPKKKLKMFKFLFLILFSLLIHQNQAYLKYTCDRDENSLMFIRKEGSFVFFLNINVYHSGFQPFFQQFADHCKRVWLMPTSAISKYFPPSFGNFRN